MDPESPRRTVGRPCTICEHAGRDQIEAALISGDSIAGISRRFAVSTDATYRHMRSHFSIAAREALAGPGGLAPSDFAARVLAVADDARTIRVSALASGRRTDALKASDSELKALNLLLDRLGIGDSEILAEIEQNDRIIRALAAVVRRDPAVADALAGELRDSGHNSEALELDLVASTARTALPTSKGATT